MHHAQSLAQYTVLTAPPWLRTAFVVRPGSGAGEELLRVALDRSASRPGEVGARFRVEDADTGREVGEGLLALDKAVDARTVSSARGG